MTGFSFQSTRAILAEPGAVHALGRLATELGCRSVLLVSDRGVEQAGLLEAGIASLRKAGIAVDCFLEVVPDPPEAIVLAGVERARIMNADGIVSIGGGSPMDTAKLIALLACSSERLADIYGVGLAKGPRLPLILAPTTAGTGSEVTPIAIVTTGENEKKGVVAPVLLPDWAVLDAELTLGLPQAVTAATGIDAMVHAIEAMTSKRLKNLLSDALAREALRLLGGNLAEVCRNGRNAEARQAMLIGSMLAGMAFANAPVAAVHALAYPIGARFHVPHGLSNALVLPHVLAFNGDDARPVYAEIAGLVLPGQSGDEAARADALRRHFTALPSQLGLPSRLSEVGIRAGDLDTLAEDAMKQTRLLINNPREVTHADARRIYEAAL